MTRSRLGQTSPRGNLFGRVDRDHDFIVVAVEEPSIMKLWRGCFVGRDRPESWSWGLCWWRRPWPGLVAGARRRAHAAPMLRSWHREAMRRITLPEGFTVSLFAAEPDVVQPIAMTIDHKGRLWVVENYSYPIWLGGPTGKDRILIFEDADHDGRFDRRTVFYDKGTNFTGIELGFGGVWVCSTPNLLFIPDQRRRCPSRRRARGQARRLGYEGTAQHVQRT